MFSNIYLVTVVVLLFFLDSMLKNDFSMQSLG